MNQYEVTYMLMANSYSSKPGMQNLKIVVQATGPNHAKELVESMFGGHSNCQAQSAWQK